MTILRGQWSLNCRAAIMALDPWIRQGDTYGYFLDSTCDIEFSDMRQGYFLIRRATWA